MVEMVPAEQGSFYSSLKYAVLQKSHAFSETESRLEEELKTLKKYLTFFSFQFFKKKWSFQKAFFPEL